MKFKVFCPFPWTSIFLSYFHGYFHRCLYVSCFSTKPTFRNRFVNKISLSSHDLPIILPTTSTSRFIPKDVCFRTWAWWLWLKGVDDDVGALRVIVVRCGKRDVVEKSVGFPTLQSYHSCDDEQWMCCSSSSCPLHLCSSIWWKHNYGGVHLMMAMVEANDDDGCIGRWWRVSRRGRWTHE